MNKIAKVLVFLGPAFFLVFLLWKDINPIGEVHATLIPGGRSPWINSPLPESRVKIDTKSQPPVFAIQGNPTYLPLRLPDTHYDSLTIAMDFQVEGQPLIEIGPQHDLLSGAFDLRSFYNQILEASVWDITKLENDNGFNYTMKNPVLGSDGSIGSALYDFPDRGEYDGRNYQRLNGARSEQVDLRGTHSWFTYIDGEMMRGEITLTDMNREVGRDDAILQVTNATGDELFKVRQDDDKDDRADQQVTKFKLSYNVPNLPRGVYRVNILTTNDVFIRQIDTPQRYLTFIDHLNIGDPVGWRDKPARTAFVGNGQAYTLQTLHADGLQTVQIGTKSTQITEPRTPAYFIAVGDGRLVNIIVPKADALVASDGLFALSADEFFDPQTRTLNAFSQLSGLSEVFTNYQRVTRQGEWIHAEQTFNIPEAWWNDVAIRRLAISAPYITQFSGEVRIKQIDLTYHKAPIDSWTQIWRIIIDHIPGI